MPDLAEVMSSFGTMSYFLVDAAPGVDAKMLAETIKNEVEKVNVVPNDEFIRNDWSVAMQMGVEIIALMTVIGGALAVLLTGFAIYSNTSRKERELAVMKALGFRNRAIYATVMLQAIVLAVLGLLLAVGLVLLATLLTAYFVPQVTLYMTLDAILRVFIAAIVVALIAGIVPVHRVVRVDPVSAFRD